MPPDPAWAPVGELERCREALKRHDSYLALWWSPIRGMHREAPIGRWRIMEWLKTQETWSHVGYWETSEGLYRAPNASEMLAWVQSMDEWARDSDLHAVSRRIDAANEAREEKAKAVKHEDTWNESMKFADIVGGHVKHFDTKPREKKELILP